MEILKTVFSMSITASIIFLIFLLIKPLSKKNFTASWHYKASIIILIFFVLPIGSFINFPRISNGIMPSISQKEIEKPSNLDTMTKRENISDIAEVQDTVEGYREDGYRGERQDKKPMEIETETNNYTRINLNINSYKDILLYIWLIGMLALFLIKIIPYIKFKSNILKSSLAVEDMVILKLFNLCKEELNISTSINLKSCQYIGNFLNLY